MSPFIFCVYRSLKGTVVSLISGRSRDVLDNAQSAEHDLCFMVQWASCHWYTQRRGNQARLCNFQRCNVAFTFHRYITSRHEKVTKVGENNHKMHRTGKKGEGRACSSIIRVVEKLQQWLHGGLSNRISHTASLNSTIVAQTIQPTISIS